MYDESMNNRDNKVFSKDSYYHIYNRGNNKQVIFPERNDYLNFIVRAARVLNMKTVDLTPKSFIRPLPPKSFDVMTYGFMSNHYHFIIQQNSTIPVDRFISKLCTSYSEYFNKKYKHIGHLFQGRFKAKLIDSDEYLMYLSAYIHNNPINPLTYEFSSFQEILGMREQILASKKILEWFDNDPEKYKKFVLNFNFRDYKKIEDFLLD